MMLGSSVAAPLSQRVQGKVLLIPGLTLFAVGMAYIDWAAHANSGPWIFLPGLACTGLGLGFTWTPIFSIATRNLRPELAGVASGVLSTIQELGGVIASASVGAVLQGRLAASLHTRAVHAASQVPAQARRQFVSSFSQAAKSGFEVGRGQSGGNLHLPASVPAATVHHIAAVAHDVFTNAFVDAMKPALAMPITVVVIAALSCLAVRATVSGSAAVETSEAIA
jgi:MFS family permease